jgi:heme A synthase
MDAGHAYNDFPYMNGQWVPDEYWAAQGWRGFFENTAAVQLHHRLLASTTLISVLTTWATFRGKLLPHASQQLLNGLAAVTALQVRYQMMHAFHSLVMLMHSAVCLDEWVWSLQCQPQLCCHECVCEEQSIYVIAMSVS